MSLYDIADAILPLQIHTTISSRMFGYEHFIARQNNAAILIWRFYLSVCLSVCLSVRQLWYVSKRMHIVKHFLPFGRGMQCWMILHEAGCLPITVQDKTSF